MRLRQIRLGVLTYFIVLLAAVVWPGALLFRAAEPLILGLPFSLFVPALGIILGGVALAILDQAEERAASEEAGGER